MAEMVGSLVVGEVVNRTSSFLIGKHRERLTTWESVERLEMAYIKMEAALDVSSRWQQATNNNVSLLRWRRKLRRAADDCDAALHRWKLRALEEEAARERLARAPFHTRVAHAVVSFVRALRALTRGNDEVSRATAAVQRFERLANGSAEFLRCAEFSSASSKCCSGAGRSFLCVGSESKGPVKDWEGKRCGGYGKRSRASGKKLLLL